MYYTWKHYTKDQILGKLENLWDRAVVEGIGFEVFDFSRGTFIDGEDVYIFVLNHKDEDHSIGGKIDEEFDEWEVGDENYNLSDEYTVDFLRPNIIEGDDDEISQGPGRRLPAARSHLLPEQDSAAVGDAVEKVGQGSDDAHALEGPRQRRGRSETAHEIHVHGRVRHLQQRGQYERHGESNEDFQDVAAGQIVALFLCHMP